MSLSNYGNNRNPSTNKNPKVIYITEVSFHFCAARWANYLIPVLIHMRQKAISIELYSAHFCTFGHLCKEGRVLGAKQGSPIYTGSFLSVTGLVAQLQLSYMSYRIQPVL